MLTDGTFIESQEGSGFLHWLLYVFVILQDLLDFIFNSNYRNFCNHNKV